MDISGVAQQQLLMRNGPEYGQLLADRTAGGGGVRRSPESPEEARQALRTAAKEFESIFVYQMVSAMRSTIVESGLVPKSNAEEIFEGMLDEEWSRKLAGKHGARGLSEILYQQLSRQMGLDEAAGQRDESSQQITSVLQIRPTGGMVPFAGQLAPTSTTGLGRERR
ncbi:rod-binding protein [Candidatus Latescibacterota bacterium]